MKKTKVDILDKYDCYEHENVKYLDAIEAMEEYSNQQLEEQRKKIKELICEYRFINKTLSSIYLDQFMLKIEKILEEDKPCLKD